LRTYIPACILGIMFIHYLTLVFNVNTSEVLISIFSSGSRVISCSQCCQSGLKRVGEACWSAEFTFDSCCLEQASNTSETPSMVATSNLKQHTFDDKIRKKQNTKKVENQNTNFEPSETERFLYSKKLPDLFHYGEENIYLLENVCIQNDVMYTLREPVIYEVVARIESGDRLRYSVKKMPIKMVQSLKNIHHERTTIMIAQPWYKNLWHGMIHWWKFTGTIVNYTLPFPREVILDDPFRENLHKPPEQALILSLFSRALGIRKGTVTWFSPNSTMQTPLCFRELMYVGSDNQFKHSTYNLKRWDLMKNRVLYSFDVQVRELNLSENICYSLRNNGRRIWNRDKILGKIRSRFPKAKVREVRLGDLSMQEQVAFAASCDAFIGPHGQNLQQSIFMPKNATLLEIFPEGHENLNYQAWTERNSHRYRQFHCRTTNNATNWRALDMRCSDETIDSILEGLIEAGF